MFSAAIRNNWGQRSFSTEPVAAVKVDLNC